MVEEKRGHSSQKPQFHTRPRINVEVTREQASPHCMVRVT